MQTSLYISPIKVRLYWFPLALCLMGLIGSQTTGFSLEPPSKIRIGCYYFPVWNTADRWVPIVEYGGRTPLLGYYRDELPIVQDWHIRQALQHHISFWVFDWYYDFASGTVLPDNAALDSGFMNASLRDEMSFVLMWCNEEAGAPAYTADGMQRMFETMRARYLSKGNYLKAPDGRAILVISRPDRLIASFGVDGLKALLKRMGAQTPGGILFAAITDPGAKDLGELKRAGFDVATAYCYAAQGLPAGSSHAPFDSIIPIAKQMWERGSKSRDIDIIPAVSPNWDSRAWYGDHAIWRTDPSPKSFERLCSTVKPYIDPKLGMAIVGTWNEFGEGTYIEPTRERGCSYLDALQRAFFGSAHTEPMLQPSQRDKAAMDFTDIPAHLEQQLAAQNGNLIINPGFETDWGWTAFDNSPILFSTTVHHSGSRSIEINKRCGGVKTQMLSPGIPWQDRCTNRIPAKKGSSFKIIAWVLGKASLTCAMFDASGGWLKRYIEVGSGGNAGSWTQISSEVTVTDADAAYMDIELIPNDGKVFVDDVSVTKSNR